MRHLPIYLVLLAMIGLAFGVGYISYPLLHLAPEPPVAPAAPTEGEADMELYWETWRLLDRDFYGAKPDVARRNYGAIRGMVESFDDPYTFFVEPQPRQLERDELAGKFGGIGASVEQTEAGYILHPQEGRPAAVAGMLDGDLLLLVDDQEITTQMTADEVVALVRGPVGSVVTLVIRRVTGANTQELTLQVKRAEIYTPSVEWRMVGTPGHETTGYIRHTLFTERSAQEMQQAIEELATQGATSYILDLRGNPGGLVSAAVQIADLWLDGGVVFIEQKADGAEQTQQATAGMLAGDVPLAVIVDAGSASASEILAGAIQDHGRGTLVGEKTFGKGSVQLIHELPDQSSLHVTNAQWLTPNRHPITAHGLQPDVPVEPGTDPLPQAIALVEAATVAQAKQ